MKFLLPLLLCLSLNAAPLPSYVGGVEPTVTRVGERILSGISVTNRLTNSDSIYNEVRTAAGGVLPIYSVTPTPVTWENRNTNVATFDGTTINVLRNGSTSIIANYGVSGRLVQRHIYFPTFSSTSAGTNYFFITNMVGSLAHHVTTNTLSRMTGSGLSRRPVFSTRDSSTQNFVRNPNFFLAGVSGIESYIAGNNSGADGMNGCAISPRHILSVYHIGSQLGQTVYFVSRTNNALVYARTVVDYSRIKLDSDQTVGLLNLPLPAEIIPAAFVSGYAAKLPQYASEDAVAYFLRKVPAIMFNQTVSPAVGYLSFLNAETCGATTSSSVFGSAWSWSIRGGDSGSPIMLVIGDRMAVVANWTSAGGGTSCWGQAAAIQSTMDALCDRNSFTNETLSYLNVSSFTSY